jgi:hypothetical protein
MTNPFIKILVMYVELLIGFWRGGAESQEVERLYLKKKLNFTIGKNAK